MFCSKCGKPVADDAAFCANCGAALKKEVAPVAEPVVEAPVAEAPVVEAPVVEPVAAEAPVQEEIPVAAPAEAYVETPVAAPVYQQETFQQAPTFNAAPAAPVDAGSLMIKGILAIALCGFGIPGIILGSMAKKLAAQFMAANGGQIFGKAKVGSILGRIGFGFGIGLTIFWAFYFIIIVGILGAL